MNITKVVTAMIMNVYLYHHHHLQCNDRVVLSASSGKIYVGAALTGRLVEEGGGSWESWRRIRPTLDQQNTEYRIQVYIYKYIF